MKQRWTIEPFAFSRYTYLPHTACRLLPGDKQVLWPLLFRIEWEFGMATPH
jgi:hypothetical protein